MTGRDTRTQPFIVKDLFTFRFQKLVYLFGIRSIFSPNTALVGDDDHDASLPYLAHSDPVDGRLPSELLNKLPLLLELLHFSFVRKHLRYSRKL